MRILALALLVCPAVFVGTIQNNKSNKETQKMATQSTDVQFVKSPTLPPSPGYTQAVRAGNTIYIAGQVAVDRSGNVVGKGDFRAQVQQVFENLKAALEASGASFKDVVKMNSYFVDMTQLAAFREVRDKYIDTGNPPASTAVQVSRLFREDFLVEIEAIAIVKQ